MKKLKNALLAVLGVAVVSFSVSEVSAEQYALPNMYDLGMIKSNVVKETFDLSTGWKVTNYSSSQGINVNDIFKQGVINKELNQKMAMANFGNIGNSKFTAEKIIPMKYGKTYDMKIIYAQFYNSTGSGYIDFNGERILADVDKKDKEFKKMVTPTKDEDFKIEIHFETPINGNGYFKLGYDMTGGGVGETPNELLPPVVSPVPEAATKAVIGTADEGNTVIVKDSKDATIGQGVVDSKGVFNITTTRVLNYQEELKVSQRNTTGMMSHETRVKVVKTNAPKSPVINKLTDEEITLSGISEPLSVVNIYVHDKDIAHYTAIANEIGEYKVILDNSYPGQTLISATATDQSGKISPETLLEVSYANPLAMKLDNENLSSVDKSVSGLTSRGACEVRVLIGNRVFDGISDESGRFTIMLNNAYPAGTEYVVEAEHVKSSEKVKLSKVVLPRVPNVPNVQSGDSSVSGEADPNAKILLHVTANGVEYSFEVTVDAKGKFTIPLLDKNGKPLVLKIGDELKIKSVLEAINMESAEITINVLAY